MIARMPVSLLEVDDAAVLGGSLTTDMRLLYPGRLPDLPVWPSDSDSVSELSPITMEFLNKMQKYRGEREGEGERE